MTDHRGSFGERGFPRPGEPVNPRADAAEEAMRAFKAATAERRRAQLFAVTTPDVPALYERSVFREVVDVTEDVVSVMDTVTATMDWGSGMFTDDDLAAFFRLADLLKIDVPDSVERPPAAESEGEE